MDPYFAALLQPSIVNTAHAYVFLDALLSIMETWRRRRRHVQLPPESARAQAVYILRTLMGILANDSDAFHAEFLANESLQDWFIFLHHMVYPYARPVKLRYTGLANRVVPDWKMPSNDW